MCTYKGHRNPQTYMSARAAIIHCIFTRSSTLGLIHHVQSLVAFVPTHHIHISKHTFPKCQPSIFPTPPRTQAMTTIVPSYLLSKNPFVPSPNTVPCSQRIPTTHLLSTSKSTHAGTPPLSPLQEPEIHAMMHKRGMTRAHSWSQKKTDRFRGRRLRGCRIGHVFLEHAAASFEDIWDCT